MFTQWAPKLGVGCGGAMSVGEERDCSGGVFLVGGGGESSSSRPPYLEKKITRLFWTFDKVKIFLKQLKIKQQVKTN